MIETLLFVGALALQDATEGLTIDVKRLDDGLMVTVKTRAIPEGALVRLALKQEAHAATYSNLALRPILSGGEEILVEYYRRGQGVFRLPAVRPGIYRFSVIFSEDMQPMRVVSSVRKKELHWFKEERRVVIGSIKEQMASMRQAAPRIEQWVERVEALAALCEDPNAPPGEADRRAASIRHEIESVRAPYPLPASLGVLDGMVKLLSNLTARPVTGGVGGGRGPLPPPPKPEPKESLEKKPGNEEEYAQAQRDSDQTRASSLQRAKQNFDSIRRVTARELAFVLVDRCSEFLAIQDGERRAAASLELAEALELHQGWTRGGTAIDKMYKQLTETEYSVEKLLQKLEKRLNGEGDASKDAELEREIQAVKRALQEKP